MAAQEEAMLNKDITVNIFEISEINKTSVAYFQQTDYEMLFVNMRFEPMFIKDRLSLKWHCENGLIKNIQKIVEEYRVQRNLTVKFQKTKYAKKKQRFLICF